MKKNILIITIAMLVMSAFAVEIDSDIEIVTVLKVGQNTGELWIGESPDYSGLEGHAIGDDYFYNGPTAMAFSDNGFLYIVDNRNKKIIKYNSNFVFISEIIVLDNNLLDPFYPNQFRVVGTSYLYYQLNGLTALIDESGGVKWIVSYPHDSEFIFENYNYYYDEKNDLFFHYFNNNEVLCVPKPSVVSSDNMILRNHVKINEYLIANNIFDVFVDLNNIVKKNNDMKKFDSQTLYNIPIRPARNLIGIDSSNNMIWDYELNRLTVKNRGKVTAAMVYYNKTNVTINRSVFPAVHPCGDIYWLEYSYGEQKIALKRIQNVWDPVGRAAWYAAHPEGSAAAKQLARITSGNVRIRSQPNLQGTQLGYVQTNDTVEILERSNEKMVVQDMNNYWYKIRKPDGMEGWVYGEFVEVKN